jgi:hypothetical protein
MTGRTKLDLPPPAERRLTSRKRVLLGGIIVGDDGRFILNCKIRDITEVAARIALPKSQNIPTNVYLINVRDRTGHDAQVKWRRGDEAGLLFAASFDLARTTDPTLSYLRRILDGRTHMNAIWRSSLT